MSESTQQRRQSVQYILNEGSDLESVGTNGESDSSLMPHTKDHVWQIRILQAFHVLQTKASDPLQAPAGRIQALPSSQYQIRISPQMPTAGNLYANTFELQSRAEEVSQNLGLNRLHSQHLLI